MKRLDYLFKYGQPGRILDIGNLDKQGRIHNLIIDKFKGSEVFGLDIENQEKYKLSFPNQFEGVVEKIPWPDNFFDTIYLGQVLEHTWTPKISTDECFRVLKKGGVLILDLPNVYSLSRILRYIILGQDIILGNPDHKIFYSRAMLDNLLRVSGFSSVFVTTENVFSFRGKLVPLPNWGVFKSYGECLVAIAIK